MSSHFPIVGVGASAGGLAALQTLLRELGPQPRVSLVIVQHLDPAHESSLPEIFSRATSLPIHVAAEGMQVEQNQVYLVPPTATLTIEQRRLKLTPRAAGTGVQHPIDQFLESLASDCGANALGVILTGSGSDGSRGIKSIKSEGGVTFAQDSSAEHRGMPTSAIATGCIDHVLPVEEIARELIRIGARFEAQPDGDDGGAAFQRILIALRKTSGIDFANYKHSTLRRRIERRVLVKGSPTLASYAELVERDAEESRTLRDEVLIHVTSFFRDPEMFEALKSGVFPKLLEKRARDTTIRIWVPGCSTGEEVYSIAIALLEFLADNNASDIPVKLFGTDVSASTIDIARAGKYAAIIEREVAQGRLDRFFVRSEGGWQIRKDVRDLCVFAKQDATRDPPFAAMDLISCRNLMIYLGSPLQDRLLPIFHYALNDPGFLVLGSSESIRSFPGFAAFDAKNRIYTRTSAAPRMVLDFSSRRLTDTAPDELSGTKTSSSLDVHREADRLVLAEFAPPGVVITEDLSIVQFRGRTGPFLEPSPGVPSFEILRMVREELRIALRQALDGARAKQIAQRSAPISFVAGAVRRNVELEVIPFRVASTSQRFFVVLFREAAVHEGAPPPAPAPIEHAPPDESALAQELASTRNYLQSVIEQLEASNEELKAANEEIISSNEELRSTNEELQMAKEELQATNEELGTVNDEMAVRNVEATRLNDDLTNVLNSVEIPIVILGRDSRLRRFTPAAAKLLHLLPGDLGRSLDGKPPIPLSEMNAMIAEVLERLSVVSKNLLDAHGRWHQLTVRPYLTLDNRIDGTVIAAFDIDAVKKSEQLIAESQKYAESIVDTVRDCLLVLDGELRVRSANRAFREKFGASERDLQGKPLDELGRGEWNIPELKQRLRSLGEHDRLEGYRVTRDFQGEPHVFVISARRIENTALVLAALDDVTEREQAEQALQRAQTDAQRAQRDYQDKLQHMAFDSAVAEESERRRIAADLHDRIGQSLALAQIKLTAVRGPLEGATRAAIDDAVLLLAQSSADTRTLIFELSPPILYDLGLKDALAWLAEELEKRQGLHVDLEVEEPELPLGDATAALVFRVIRELLMNVFKHSKSSLSSVALERTDGELFIEVKDEGVGFDPKEINMRTAAGGFGLFSAREQINRLGGRFEVDSSPGRGTAVRMHVPLSLSGKAKAGAR